MDFFRVCVGEAPPNDHRKARAGLEGAYVGEWLDGVNREARSTGRCTGVELMRLIKAAVRRLSVELRLLLVHVPLDAVLPNGGYESIVVRK